MNCNDCCYNLPRDGYSYCTYEDGECIKISMLEKENAELEDKLANVDYQLEGRDLEIKELEKENAELKKQVEQKQHLADVRLEQRIDVDIALEDTTDKLTKAKEIIREFMKYEINEYDGSLEIHFEELKKQAEQFLK